MNKFDKTYWENNYLKNNIGWDIGIISPPLKSYIDQLKNKNLKILIPGAGNGYEIKYLFNLGFKNIFVLDIAAQPLENIQKHVPNFPKENLIQQDFFDHSGEYDLILEQTFFCALNLGLREKYVDKMIELLKPKSKLVGLLFNFDLKPGGPPFGGSQPEYEQLFSPKFKLTKLEPCHNSIKSRDGIELFFIFEKK